MTNRLTPDEVRRALGSDADVVRLLADSLEAKTMPAQTKTPTKTPVKKAPSQGGTVKKLRSKTTPRNRPTPKPRVSITLDPGALAPREVWSPPTYGTPTAAPGRSAHDEPGPTPCFVCGGSCDAKEDRWGNWRRHRECLSVTQPWQRVRAAAEWFALRVSDSEAYAADLFVADYGDEHASPLYSKDDVDRSPWSHIKMSKVVRAVLEARQALAETEVPKECEQGACAWCGVAESLTWTDAGHVRHDGTSAPLCSICAPCFDKYPGSAAFFEDQRGGIAEALTGVSPDMLETFPAELRAHAEVGGGDGEPWSHLPPEAVEAFRWERWGRYGGAYALPEHKAEAVARAEALEADRATRMAVTEKADPYGFHGSQEG